MMGIELNRYSNLTEMGIELNRYSDLKRFLFSLQTTTEDGKPEKKNDQPPSAKKPKVKTKTVELPIENSLHWQLANDMLNLFVESEVMLEDN